jgi:hypothetical protein
VGGGQTEGETVGNGSRRSDAPGGGKAECVGLVANGDELVAQEARVSFGDAVVEPAHESLGSAAQCVEPRTRSTIRSTIQLISVN